MNCEGDHRDATQIRSVYSCRYGTDEIEGSHGEHVWYSHIYHEYMRCYGQDENPTA